MKDVRTGSRRSRRFVKVLLLLAAIAALLLFSSIVSSAMPGASSCTASGCHLGVTTSGSITHPDINCDTSGCHDGYGFASFDSSDHIGESCTYCHSASFPAVPQHTDANLAAPHVTTTVGCTDCHSSSLIPTHEVNPAFTCQTCHSSTNAAVQTAIAAGNTACIACHPGADGHVSLHDDGTTDPGCLSCHDSNTSAEHGDVCATCHNSADPVVIAAIAANDVTCDACHDVVTAHDALHEGGTADPGCLSCHDGNISTEHGGTCATCHNSTDPVVIAAIAANDVTCDACHDLGTAHAVFHDGGTADPTCLSCHNANVSTEHLDNCALCHSSTDPVVIAAIAANDVSCGACHTVATAHDAFHLNGTADPTCLSCHDANISVEHGGTCATCHSSADPVVIAAIAANDTSCGACHTVATAHSVFHDGATADPTCLSCHDANASTEHGDVCATCHSSADPVVIAAIAANDVTCGACHTVATAHDAFHLNGTADPACLACHDANISVEHGGTCATCHSSTDPAVIAAIAANDTSCGACHDTAAAHDAYHLNGTADPTCLACHDANISTEHGGTCATCHSSADPAVIAAIAANDTSCGACHDLGTAHVAFHNGGTVDPTCLACHDGNVSTEHGDACATCHSSADPAVMAAIAANDVTCGACHNVAAAHDALHDGGTTDPSCLECHDSNISVEHSADCATCHESVDPTVVNAIATNQVACTACHGAIDHSGAHTGIASPECGDCHGSDVSGIHASCTVCHNPVAPVGATCVSCHTEIDLGSHGFPFYNGPYNPEYAGYLSWGYAEIQSGSAGSSPHGNYTTSSTKCAICHAVHRADPDGVVLTAWGGVGSAVPAFSSTMAPFESCFFCHGNGATFTDRTVEFFVTATGVLSPHTTCGRCHTASPHGAGGSHYPLLASKLINQHADYQIHYDLTAGANGVSLDMFDLTNESLVAQGTTLATGYLCVGCHGSATNQHVFAVNERGAQPAIHYGTLNGDGHAFQAAVTGHQVWIGASETWSNPGTWYSGGGAHDYYLAIYKYVIGGVERWFKVNDATTFYEITVGSAGDPADRIGGPFTSAAIVAMGTFESQIAYNNAYGCAACHDARRTNGQPAFPHGYVNSAGAPAPKWSNRTEGLFDGTTLDTSFIWLTKAADADDARTLVNATLQSGTTQKVWSDANQDGVCLKCHVAGDGSEGVGITY